MLAGFADSIVMVVVRDASDLHFFRALLELGGIRSVHTFSNPGEAVACLAQIRPDLVLIDLHMPHLDGYGVLGRLAAHAGGNYLPALVLIDDPGTDFLEGALGSGARDFVTKPFDTVEVTLRVRNLLETRFLHKALHQHNMWLRARVDGYRLVERIERDERQVEYDRIAAAIRDETVSILFQSVFEIESGVLVGVEALARFPAEPIRGPDHWFAAASRVGLGVELETLALRLALRSLGDLPEGLFLAVNVSPAVLLSEGVPSACLAHAGPQLILELTEHVPVQDYDALNASLAAFRTHGTRLAVDDTGAGYAGFRHLLGLRPDIVKLDLSLTQGIDSDPARKALAGALVTFTQDTHSDLIAEGVETKAELDTLRSLKVAWAQGYYLGRPQSLSGALSPHRLQGRPAST